MSYIEVSDETINGVLKNMINRRISIYVERHPNYIEDQLKMEIKEAVAKYANEKTISEESYNILYEKVVKEVYEKLLIKIKSSIR